MATYTRYHRLRHRTGTCTHTPHVPVLCGVYAHTPHTSSVVSRPVRVHATVANPNPTARPSSPTQRKTGPRTATGRGPAARETTNVKNHFVFYSKSRTSAGQNFRNLHDLYVPAQSTLSPRPGAAPRESLCNLPRGILTPHTPFCCANPNARSARRDHTPVLSGDAPRGIGDRILHPIHRPVCRSPAATSTRKHSRMHRETRHFLPAHTSYQPRVWLEPRTVRHQTLSPLPSVSLQPRMHPYSIRLPELREGRDPPDWVRQEGSAS